jgi:NAD(P)H-quinone oxidoreductase subunit 5
MSALLAAILALPLLAALGALIAGSRRPRLVGFVGAWTAGAGFVGACVLAVRVAARGPVSADLTSAGGALVAGLEANRLTVLLLVLVFGVSSVAQVFAVRYLACDDRAGWFTAGAALLTAASAGLMTSATLIGLGCCWTVAGVALCLLLATYWELPAARDGVRRTATAFLLGDLALWTAIGLLTIRWGNVRLFSLSATPFGHSSPSLVAAACLIVIAALSRSAQVPFQRWLPATLAAPTPISALLHAGVVNAGGVLLVRMSPIVSGSAIAMGIAFVAGSVSMVYGAVVMLLKTDIKGSLVYSTMAQMGFMILTCGLGLPAATVFHLTGHGFYKATLFLSSGSAIARRRRKAARPPVPRPVRRVAMHVTALVAPAAALYLADYIIGPSHAERGATSALLIFAWATGAAAMTGWLARNPGPRTALTGTAALLVAAVGYAALVRAVTSFIAPDLPPLTVPSASSAGIVVVAVVLGALTWLRQAPAYGRAGRWQRALYATALTAGHVPVTRHLPAPTHPTRTQQLTGAPR